MAGWGSNNKFSMLGAMRAIAQMVSYELPLVIAVLPVVMVVGSLSPDAIVAAQSGHTSACYRIGSSHALGRGDVPPLLHLGLVESNRTPFDVPKASRRSSPAT
jgi:NADH-quinone oxidoreductase subunit H